MANSKAGMKLPMIPTPAIHRQRSPGIRRACRSVTGKRVAPAMVTRKAAKSTGGNKAEPSRANSPIFIKMKLLPHTNPSSKRTRAGAKR